MYLKLILTPFIILFFIACAGLTPSVPEPSVSINGFNVLPSSGVSPRFEIQMRIINTSRETLNIDGIVYTVEIQGNEVLTGVAKDIPSIAPYSEGNVSVAGSPDLFGSLGLFKDMMSQKSEKMVYEVDVAIDVGSSYPIIHSTKKGEFSLSEAMKK
jgi:hypothetical protein